MSLEPDEPVEHEDLQQQAGAKEPVEQKEAQQLRERRPLYTLQPDDDEWDEQDEQDEGDQQLLLELQREQQLEQERETAELQWLQVQAEFDWQEHHFHDELRAAGFAVTTWNMWDLYPEDDWHPHHPFYHESLMGFLRDDPAVTHLS
jgi:hypothetical protein